MPRLKTDTIQHDDFMCRCSKKERARCARVVAAARAIYDARSKGNDRYPHNDLGFVDFMLFYLADEGELFFATDQWSAVSFRVWDEQPDGKVRGRDVSSWIQCDSIVDGIAATFLLHHNEGLFER